MCSDKRIVNRATYSLSEAFAEIGGLAKALEVLGGIVTIMFAHFRMQSLLSNRLYEDDPEESKTI